MVGRVASSSSLVDNAESEMSFKIYTNVTTQDASFRSASQLAEVVAGASLYSTRQNAYEGRDWLGFHVQRLEVLPLPPLL
jgi:hypothetical protein